MYNLQKDYRFRYINSINICCSKKRWWNSYIMSRQSFIDRNMKSILQVIASLITKKQSGFYEKVTKSMSGVTCGGEELPELDIGMCMCYYWCLTYLFEITTAA